MVFKCLNGSLSSIELMICRSYKFAVAFDDLLEFLEWIGGLVVHDIESGVVAS